MAVPITGFEGTITVNGTAVGKVIKWDGTIDFKESEWGPYIAGDGSTDVLTTAKTVKGKLEALIPEKVSTVVDAGQELIITNALAFGSVNLVLKETEGYTLTIPIAKITTIAVDNDANGTGKINFQFRNSGSFTFAVTT